MDEQITPERAARRAKFAEQFKDVVLTEEEKRFVREHFGELRPRLAPVRQR